MLLRSCHSQLFQSAVVASGKYFLWNCSERAPIFRNVLSGLELGNWINSGNNNDGAGLLLSSSSALLGGSASSLGISASFITIA